MTNSLYENRTKAISGVIGAVAGYWLVSQSRKNKYKTWKKIAGGILGTTLGVEIAKNMINKKKAEEKKSKVLPVIAKYRHQPSPEPSPVFTSNSEFWNFMSGITEGIDNLVSSLMSYVFSSHPKETLVNMDYLIQRLSKIHYGILTFDEPVFRNSNSRNKTDNFLMESDFFEKTATSLPIQSDATFEDTKDIKPGYSAGVLIAGIFKKWKRNIGDIFFEYTFTDGILTDWAIFKISSDSANLTRKYYSKEEALGYLEKHKEKFYENKDFYYIYKHLD